MLGCVELCNLRKLALTPPHIRTDLKYKEHAKELRSAFVGLWAEYGALGIIAGGVLFHERSAGSVYAVCRNSGPRGMYWIGLEACQLAL